MVAPRTDGPAGAPLGGLRHTGQAVGDAQTRCDKCHDISRSSFG